MQTILQTKIPGQTPVRGKVRDIYDLGDKLLIVATDRISAFDVVMPNGIPDKGIVLTQISEFWFDFLGGQIEHHLISDDVADLPKPFSNYARAARRPLHAGPQGPGPAHRVRRPRLPGRLRLEGIPAERHRLRHQAARGTQAVPEAARADLHAVHQGRARPTTRTSASTRPPRSSAPTRRPYVRDKSIEVFQKAGRYAESRA